MFTISNFLAIDLQFPSLSWHLEAAKWRLKAKYHVGIHPENKNISYITSLISLHAVGTKYQSKVAAVWVNKFRYLDRTIALMSHLGKVLMSVLTQRLRAQTEEHLADEQAGFRKDRSTVQQILTLRLIGEKARRKGKKNSTALLTFKKHSTALIRMYCGQFWTRTE